MSDMISDAVAASAFRRLITHLQHRKDVQNIDLMGHSGFCRNCLSDWIMEADNASGGHMDKASARAIIHGMPMDEWKEKYQSPASEEQLLRMKESVAKNAS